MTPQEKQEKKGKLLIDQDVDDLDHTDHTYRLDPIAAVMSCCAGSDVYLKSTDLTLETRPRSCRSYGYHLATGQTDLPLKS